VLLANWNQAPVSEEISQNPDDQYEARTNLQQIHVVDSIKAKLVSHFECKYFCILEEEIKSLNKI
jgi:hypothetical protein